jgi:hypothetical protein
VIEQTSTATKKDWLDRLFELDALMGSTTFAGEAEACRQQILKLLEKHGKIWHDMPNLLDTVKKRRALATPSPESSSQPSTPRPPSGDPITAINLFKVVRALFRTYVAFETPYHYVALALWTMHTRVFKKFRFTPRLILTSAIRGSGKSTAFDVLENLVPRPERPDNTTGATIMRQAENEPTFLLDEADNLNLFNDPTFRAVLNSGYRRGGKITRTINNLPTTFPTFAALALASLGSLPLPLMRRSINIRMQRATEEEKAQLQRYDESNPDQQNEFRAVYLELSHWACKCELVDPSIPDELTATQADNWRPLLSCADACGSEIGEIAREAAIALCRGLDEDLEVSLLSDIRVLFDQQRTGQLILESHPVNNAAQLCSKTIIANLNALPHGLWSDWAGRGNDQTPRPLTEGTMAKMLGRNTFEIRPVTLWPRPRGVGAKSAKGYRRRDFERAWERYCPLKAGTAAQPNEIRGILTNVPR